MILSQEILTDLSGYGVLSGRAPMHGHGNRRCNPRNPMAAAAKVLRLQGRQGQREMSARVRDIAAGGISLTCSEPICFGERFIVTLPLESGGTIDIECIATRWFPTDKNLCIVGAVFDRLMTPA